MMYVAKQIVSTYNNFSKALKNVEKIMIAGRLLQISNE